MTESRKVEASESPEAARARRVREAAKRALAEAQARRAAAPGTDPAAKEEGGPAGPEPTRYGDWERKGRAYDF